MSANLFTASPKSPKSGELTLERMMRIIGAHLTWKRTGDDEAWFRAHVQAMVTGRIPRRLTGHAPN